MASNMNGSSTASFPVSLSTPFNEAAAFAPQIGSFEPLAPVARAETGEWYRQHSDYGEPLADSRYSSYGPAEKSAAATLLMVRIFRAETETIKKRDTDKKKQERWNRLNQNQQYRKQLRDMGVYPIKDDTRVYRCSLCSEKFEKEMFVWRHGVKHLPRKPFECNVCHGTFNRSDSLQRHVRNFHKDML